MAIRSENAPDPQVREGWPPLPYSPEYKQAILAEYERLDRTEKGALLRRGGAYTQLTSRRRLQRDPGGIKGPVERNGSGSTGRLTADPRDRRIAELEAEKARLAAELERARQVVEVQSRLSALLGHLAPGIDATQ